MSDGQGQIFILHYTGGNGDAKNDYYFIGSSREAITADALQFVKKPSKFIGEITLERARELNLEFLESGLESVRSGTSKSYLLGLPQPAKINGLLAQA